jgi:1,4-dihydroxy-2-naphthoyl-CoA hydrolase
VSEAADLSPADLLATIPYSVALGMTLDEATPQLVRGSLPWSPERCTTSGVMHGGALHATARPLHVGRSFIVVRTDLTDDQDQPVGQTTQTQAVLAPRPPG